MCWCFCGVVVLVFLFWCFVNRFCTREMHRDLAQVLLSELLQRCQQIFSKASDIHRISCGVHKGLLREFLQRSSQDRGKQMPRQNKLEQWSYERPRRNPQLLVGIWVVTHASRGDSISIRKSRPEEKAWHPHHANAPDWPSERIKVGGSVAVLDGCDCRRFLLVHLFNRYPHGFKMIQE